MKVAYDEEKNAHVNCGIRNKMLLSLCDCV